MKYRFLGDTGIKVSGLCLGTMTFGKEADEDTSAAIFNKCRDAGINFFDCADAYGKGRAEEILGGLISDCRSDIILTTKVYGQIGPGINDRGLTRRHILDAIEGSLKRLNTDYIDLYFLHHFDSDTPMEEYLRAFDDLITQGKIRYMGASNFAAWQIMKAQGICTLNGWHRIKCIQPMYNLVKRQAEVELLPMAQSENVGVICYNPLAAGLLSGKYAAGEDTTRGRLDHDAMYKSRYRESWMHQAANRFYEYSKKLGYHPVSLAVAWAGSHPAVTAPIIGARNPDQLTDSINAVEIDMTPEIYEEISALSPKPAPTDDRTETPESRKNR